MVPQHVHILFTSGVITAIGIIRSTYFKNRY